MSFTRKVAYNTVVQGVGKVLNLGITFITTALLTRYLGVSDYGTFTLAFAFVNFFAVFADFGFFTILVREISKEQHEDKKVINNILTLRTLIAALVFFLAYIIAYFIPSYDHSVKQAIGFASIAIFFLAINQTIVGVFQSKFRMDKAVISDMVGRILILGLIFWLLQQHASLFTILVIYIIGNLSNLIISYIFAAKYVFIKPRFEFDFWRYILKDSASLSVILILSAIYFRNDMILLGIFKNSEDIGIYGVSYKVFEILMAVPSMFLGASFPVLSRLIHQDRERLQRILQKSFNFLVMISLPVSIGGILFAKNIIGVIGGEEFLAASTVSFAGAQITATHALQILMAGMFFIYLTDLFKFTILAAGRQSILILPNLFFLVFNLGLNLYLIPRYSYLAAAFTTLASEFLIFLTTAYLFKRKLGFSVSPFPILWQSLLSIILMCLILNLLISINFWILILLGALIYFIALYLLGGMNKEVILEVIKKPAA